jgi:hypothetical protein
MPTDFELGSLLLALLAVWLAYRSNRLQRVIAQAQGAFKVPNILVAVYGQHDSRRFILLVPPEIPAIPFEVKVLNTGDASARSLELVWHSNKALATGLQVQEEARGPSISQVSETTHTYTLLIKVPVLNPGQAIRLASLLPVLSPTRVQNAVVVTTADSKDLSVEYSFEFAYRIDISVFQEDRPPISDHFSISVIHTAGRSATQTLLEENVSYRKALQAELRRLPWRQRLRRRLNAHRVGPSVRVVSFDTARVSQLSKSKVELAAAVFIWEGMKGELGYFVPGLDVFWESKR